MSPPAAGDATAEDKPAEEAAENTDAPAEGEKADEGDADKPAEEAKPDEAAPAAEEGSGDNAEKVGWSLAHWFVRVRTAPK